jgi:hypothetical protein
MTDFRALCAELLAALENEGYAHWVHTPDEDELCLRARAELAKPEPEGPTRRQLMMLADDMGMTTVGAVTPAEYARAILARWGRPAPQPIPVSERLPRPEDCDAEGRCWWFCFECPGEHSYWIFAKEVYCEPPLWLPAHALPLPTSDQH